MAGARLFSNTPPDLALRSRRGFTLVELLVATSIGLIAVASAWALWQSMHTSLWRQGQRGSQQGAAAVEGGLLERIISQGGGVLQISSQHMRFLDSRDSVRELYIAADTLYLDGSPILESAVPGTISWTVRGIPPEDPSNGSNWNWRTPDRDDNGWLDWEELDQDRSGTLDATELSLATLWILRYQRHDGTAIEGVAYLRNSPPHPRNFLD